MQKISKSILYISPKNLAIYLIIYPLILVFLHTIFSFTYRNQYGFNDVSTGIISTLLTITLLLFVLPLLLWLLWLRATTLSVKFSELGIPVKWFHVAFCLFLFYLICNASYSTLVEFLKNTAEDYVWILYASRETINFIGLLILYPILCHYSARSIYVHKTKAAATFSNSIVFTLLLIFIPIAIPFLHKYVSPVEVNNRQLIVIYAIGFGIVCVIFVMALIASIAGII